MACLIAPAAAAIVTTAIRNKIPARYRIGLLLSMLWGGVLMLFADHLISGEIVPYPPFLTAGADKIAEEIFAAGIPMTLIVLAAWIVMVAVTEKSHKTAINGKSV